MRRLFAAMAILMFVGCTYSPTEIVKGQYFSTRDGSVELQFPAGWYKEQKDNPFDLQCTSKDELMTTGVFLFTKSDVAQHYNPHRLLELQIDDLKSKRNNFELFEEEKTIQLDTRSLTTVVYAGEKNARRYYYKFTLITFANTPDMPLVVLQTTAPSNWAKHKTILEEITTSARIKPKI